MMNDEGENVDLYIPRKCSWTNRLITAKDHASIQVNIGHLDETGVYTGQYTTLALSGFVRTMVRPHALAAKAKRARCLSEQP
jgi:small subunit ribosomal protein S21e